MLIQEDVEVTPEAVEHMFQLLYGPRRQARLMTLPTLVEAEQAIAEVNAGAAFGTVATNRSTDSSAARGGLLEPISSVDPRYPRSLRQQLWLLRPGELSPPIPLGSQFAVLRSSERSRPSPSSGTT